MAWNLNRWRVNRFCRASSGLVHLACFVTVSRTREVTLGEMTSEMASVTNPASDRVMGVGDLGVPEIAMAGEMAGEIPSPGREGELGSRACKRSRVGEVRWRAVLAYTSGPVGEGRLRRGRGAASGGGAAGGEAATGERPGR